MGCQYVVAVALLPSRHKSILRGESFFKFILCLSGSLFEDETWQCIELLEGNGNGTGKGIEKLGLSSLFDRNEIGRAQFGFSGNSS